MSDQTEVAVPAESPAPEQEITAVPVTEEHAPESAEEQKTKTFSQEELDDAIGKRLARERRKWDREKQTAQPPAPPVDLSIDQFRTPEEYAEALAERRAIDIIEQREVQRQQQEMLATYQDKEEDARSKYDDFERVAYNPNLPITDAMAQAIRSSDGGPDIAYFLGKNPQEADRIAALSPLMQAKEIGKLEAKLSAEPVSHKKTTAAPPPINPVTPRGSTPSYDTTDPRSIKQMSTSEWIAAERARQQRKWSAANR